MNANFSRDPLEQQTQDFLGSPGAPRGYRPMKTSMNRQSKSSDSRKTPLAACCSFGAFHSRLGGGARTPLNAERGCIEPGGASRVFDDTLNFQIGDGLTEVEIVRDGGPAGVAGEPLLNGVGHDGNEPAQLRIARRLKRKPGPAWALRYFARAPDPQTRSAVAASGNGLNVTRLQTSFQAILSFLEPECRLPGSETNRIVRHDVQGERLVRGFFQEDPGGARSSSP